MDIEYLVEKIKEELCDSKDYIKKAIELKPMTDSWAKKLYEMSVEEHKHANNLYSMFDEYCSKVTSSFTNVPQYIADARTEVIDTYSEYTACIKALWDIYKG